MGHTTVEAPHDLLPLYGRDEVIGSMRALGAARQLGIADDTTYTPTDQSMAGVVATNALFKLPHPALAVTRPVMLCALVARPSGSHLAMHTAIHNQAVNRPAS